MKYDSYVTTINSLIFFLLENQTTYINVNKNKTKSTNIFFYVLFLWNVFLRKLAYLSILIICEYLIETKTFKLRNLSKFLSELVFKNDREWLKGIQEFDVKELLIKSYDSHIFTFTSI